MHRILSLAQISANAILIIHAYEMVRAYIKPVGFFYYVKYIDFSSALTVDLWREKLYDPQRDVYSSEETRQPDETSQTGLTGCRNTFRF